ncbi:hypothetical protein FRB95_010572 [Tulasnella sp. JGI-2019a]|nr:hypothetical protein FRB95_010572 [Tulasnella sp. JGI-2019a]
MPANTHAVAMIAQPRTGKVSKAANVAHDFATPIAEKMSSLQDIFSNNTDAIMSVLSSNKVGDIAAPLQQALNALDSLQSIHPFIAVAVVAVKAVVNLELKRRANDKRIGAVYAAILDMFSVLFELSDVNDLERVDPKGGTMKGRLTTSLDRARDEIKIAANSIDKYSKSRFIVKVLKANQWEEKLVEHTETFHKRKQDLKFSLQVHTAVAVDKMQADVKDMSAMLAQVLRNQTAKEKELQALIDSKGGAAAVVQQDDVLLEISVKYEEKDSWDKSSSAGSKGKELQKSVDAGLRLELMANLDDLLKSNETLFLKKFEAQTAQLSLALDRSADKVIKALSKGAYERVEDPDLRAIWRDEKWRSNVKARHLILSFHDYFTEPKATPDDEPHEDAEKLTTITPGHPEEWTLEYMSPLYVSPIQDALDDDGSGFVSINEINEFTRQKPKDMSLPVWIAYWAAGWDIDSEVYERKITGLIKQMRGMRNEVLDANKEAVESYLDSELEFIEKLTVYDVDEDDREPDLLEMVETQRAKDEARIRKNLEDIKFEIDGPATVLAVCGPGRIDRYLLPLLYSLIKRHAQIIKLCKEYILDARELELASSSLNEVVEQVYTRISNLKAGFTQQRLDLDKTFEFFCSGLYDELYQLWHRDTDTDSEDDSDDDDSDDEETSDAESKANVAGGTTAENETPDANKNDDEDEDKDKDGDEDGDGDGDDDGDGDGDKDEDGDGDEDAEPEEDAESEDGTEGTNEPPTTVPEEVVPISVDLLRYPATKAEKEVIEAHEEKLKREKEANDAAGTDDGTDGDVAEDAGPPKTVEDRLETLESQMQQLLTNMKEVLSRLPPKRR